MDRINRFRRRYGSNLFHLLAEEYLGWLCRSWPGMAGMAIRWWVYRLLLKEIRSFPLIYPGVYLTHTYGISIGRNFSINTGAHLDGRGGIRIGDNVMVGPYAVIVSSHHDHQQVGVPMNSLDHVFAPVTIQDDVWIGSHAVIRDGVNIGRGVVVGAGGVVTHDVADYRIVGGVPAKVVGERKPGS